jgi:DNA modification methylase
MPRPRSTRPLPARPAGLTEHLTAQSRQRRQTCNALAETAAHAPSVRNDLSPLLKIERIPIDRLKPAPRRVRRSQPKQLAKIMSSIRRFGLCAPILISRDRVIIHGHAVWEAARQLGIEEISCVVVDHLSPTDQRMLVIALNKLGETGTWDFDAVRLEFQELTVLEEDLFVTGFEMAEIDMVLVSEEVETPEAEADGIPPLADIAVSRTGDVWILGDHKLTQGDAREARCYDRIFEPGELAQLVFTDVPFNVKIKQISGDARHRDFAMAAGEMSRTEFAAFNREWMTVAADHTADGGLVSTAIDWRSVDIVIGVGRDLGLDLINVIVWSKSNAGQGSLWRSAHELFPVFKKGDAPHVNNIELGRHGRWRSNVWCYPGGSSLGSDSRDGLQFHPTTKPRAMLEDALLDVTNPGDIVIDCFVGSGTMIVAAEATGRRCRAIEIDGLYCDVAIRRWQEMTGREAILQATGDTFARVAETRAAGAPKAPETPVGAIAEGGM